MLRRIKRLIKRLLGKFGVITKYFEKDPCIIMWIDGGFCSQIFRYLKGEWFARRGFRVKYDISWFDNNPMDCLKSESRDFLMTFCFPHLKLEVAQPRELLKYRLLYSTDIHNIPKRFRGHYSELKPPLYNHVYDLDDLISSEAEYEELLPCLHWEGLHDILGPEARKIEQSILHDIHDGLQVIGLHVRRGDMVDPRFAYARKVLTSQYYAHVLNLAVDRNSVVYIFSNGFDFVLSDVVPHIKCKYVLANTTSSVWEDTFLCSLCPTIIAGQGSLARWAYKFCSHPNRKLICPLLFGGNGEATQKFYANCRGTVETVALSEDMYQH